MELKFSNTTKCTKQLYNEFVNFHANKYGKKYKREKILMLIAVVYMIIFNIIQKNIFMFIAILGIYILYMVYSIKRQKKIVKNELKSDKVQKEEDITFNFYEKYFEVIVGNKIQNLKYRELYRIHKDKKNFYLYIAETRAFIVNKKSFSVGTSVEFNRFIAEKCLLKYRK